jgi:hypothetical protein
MIYIIFGGRNNMIKNIIIMSIVFLLIFPFLVDALSKDRDVMDVDSENILYELIDDTGWFTSLDIDSNDFAHISYYDYTNGNLKYCKYDGFNSDIITVDFKGDVGRYSSIAVDSHNYPHISYYDRTNGDLKYAFFSGTNWELQTLDRIGNVGMYTSITIDTQDNPHISYCDYQNRFVKYAYWSGNRWNREIVDKSAVMCVYEYFGDYTSISLDSNDNPHISYCDFENYDLKYAYKTNDIWVTEVVDSEGEVGHYSSIIIDEDGIPHISYVYLTKGISLHFDLKYASKNEDTWEIQSINKEGDIRKWTSIKLDHSGKPHISYYDYYEGSLNLAFFNGEKWIIEEIEREGSTGCFNSICINSNNKPCISYYDWGNKALKFATKTEDEWNIQIIQIDQNCDLLDQEQRYCCGWAYPIQENEPIAQSFIPTLPTLTRIELMLVKRYTPQRFNVSIRKNLDSENLVSISLNQNEIAEDLSWKNFDLSDLSVTPGQTYHIVCSAEKTGEYNMYYWYYGINNSYKNGCGWRFDKTWKILTVSGFPEIDLGFKTYGLNTSIPTTPILTGPSKGRIGESYQYSLKSYDADGDDIYYRVDWGEELNTYIFGPFPSGELVIINHSWSKTGSFAIYASAIDTNGAESGYGKLMVNMQKNNIFQINGPIINYIKNYLFKSNLVPFNNLYSKLISSAKFQ